MKLLAAPSLAVAALLLLSSCSGPQQPHEPQSSQLPAPAPSAATQKPAPVIGPESAKGEDWQYIVNNALRTADEYATEKNPNAVFIGLNIQADFIEQVAGEHKGRYLLKVVNNHNGNTSFAMLLPLFDEYSSPGNLDDSGKLWKVVSAKYNGHKF